MRTVAGELAAAEERRRTADRGVGDAKKALQRWTAAVAAEHGEGPLPADLAAQGDRLASAFGAARDAAKRAEGEVSAWQRAQAEENEEIRLQNDIRDTGVRGPGSSSAEHGLGTFRTAAGGSGGGPRWLREDGRPAVVERGQRFADHPVVAEQIGRAAERDRHIIGMHGGLGELVRSISTTSGSAVVPSVWAADVVDLARNYAAVYKAGAQTVPMDAKIVQIGRITGDATASFRTEGSTITASDPTFDNVTLTAVTLNALVVGSMEWFQDTTPGGGADQLVSEALAKKIALAIDQAALFGQITTGAEQTATGNNMLPTGGLPSPVPRGILANLLANASTSVLGSATNGTVQTAATFWKEVLDTIWTPRDFNEAPNALMWPSHLARIYAEATDTQNNPMRVPADVDQINKFVSNQVPSGFTQGTGTLMSDLFVGDFTQLLIGQRLDLQITVLDQRYAELGQIALLATWRGDIQLARPRAFCVYRYLKGT